MTDRVALPRLELLDPDPAGAVWIDGLQQLDQAVIVIEGREEDTITIECEGARELAERLARLVNHHAAIIKALEAAAHALRSYEFGNGSPDLAHDIAAHCDAIKEQAAA